MTNSKSLPKSIVNLKKGIHSGTQNRSSNLMKHQDVTAQYKINALQQSYIRNKYQTLKYQKFIDSVKPFCKRKYIICFLS